MGCLKIAIADDNENMLRALGQVINGESDMNLVGTATNGKDTYDIIKSKEPDVVLLDIIMPNGDGLAVMQKVQQDKEIKKEPAFIIISAVGKERLAMILSIIMRNLKKYFHIFHRNSGNYLIFVVKCQPD